MKNKFYYICLLCGDRNITYRNPVCSNKCNYENGVIDNASIDFGNELMDILFKSSEQIDSYMYRCHLLQDYEKVIYFFEETFVNQLLKTDKYSEYQEFGHSHLIAVHYLHQYLYLRNVKKTINNKSSEIKKHLQLSTKNYTFISEADGDFIDGKSGNVHYIRKENAYGKTTFLNELNRTSTPRKYEDATYVDKITSEDGVLFIPTNRYYYSREKTKNLTISKAFFDEYNSFKNELVMRINNHSRDYLEKYRYYSKNDYRDDFKNIPSNERLFSELYFAKTTTTIKKIVKEYRYEFPTLNSREFNDTFANFVDDEFDNLVDIIKSIREDTYDRIYDNKKVSDAQYNNTEALDNALRQLNKRLKSVPERMINPESFVCALYCFTSQFIYEPSLTDYLIYLKYEKTDIEKELLQECKKDKDAEFDAVLTINQLDYYSAFLRTLETVNGNYELVKITDEIEGRYTNTNHPLIHNNVTIQNKNNKTYGDEVHYPSGVYNLLVIITNILFNTKHGDGFGTNKIVVLIDEPEVSLHYEYQLALNHFFNKVTRKYNMIIIAATHSPFLTSDFETELKRNN